MWKIHYGAGTSATRQEFDKKIMEAKRSRLEKESTNGEQEENILHEDVRESSHIERINRPEEKYADCKGGVEGANLCLNQDVCNASRHKNEVHEK